MSFVTDSTASFWAEKEDLRPIPSGSDEKQFWAAAHANQTRTALIDVREQFVSGLELPLTASSARFSGSFIVTGSSGFTHANVNGRLTASDAYISNLTVASNFAAQGDMIVSGSLTASGLSGRAASDLLIQSQTGRKIVVQSPTPMDVYTGGRITRHGYGTLSPQTISAGAEHWTFVNNATQDSLGIVETHVLYSNTSGSDESGLQFKTTSQNGLIEDGFVTIRSGSNIELGKDPSFTQSSGPTFARVGLDGGLDLTMRSFSGSVALSTPSSSVTLDNAGTLTVSGTRIDLIDDASTKYLLIGDTSNSAQFEATVTPNTGSTLQMFGQGTQLLITCRDDVGNVIDSFSTPLQIVSPNGVFVSGSVDIDGDVSLSGAHRQLLMYGPQSSIRLNVDSDDADLYLSSSYNTYFEMRTSGEGYSGVEKMASHTVVDDEPWEVVNYGVDMSGTRFTKDVLVLGDVRVTGSVNGLVLQSPDGTNWRLTIDDTGTLTANSI